MNPKFNIRQTYHRQNDLHDRFGGNRQSGIAACTKHPIIFLFETPSGKESGYQDSHITEDTYYYTGEGSKGDMEFPRGNKAILDHQGDGKELHLFKKVKSGLYEYLVNSIMTHTRFWRAKILKISQGRLFSLS